MTKIFIVVVFCCPNQKREEAKLSLLLSNYDTIKKGFGHLDLGVSNTVFGFWYLVFGHQSGSNLGYWTLDFFQVDCEAQINFCLVLQKQIHIIVNNA